MVYEKGTKHRREMEAHIWSYRPRISLKHLVQSMQREKTATKDISALKFFLEQVMIFASNTYSIQWHTLGGWNRSSLGNTPQTTVYHF